MTDALDIRLDAALDGGALNDVGGYPLRLVRLLFGTDPLAASATCYDTADRVDPQTAAA